LLGLYEQDKLELPGWINMTKIFEDVEEDNAVVGGLPKNLNPKQLLAYKIICNHIKGVIEDKEKGTMNTPQLLLNISCAAGTRKSFWLNTVRRYIKSCTKPSSSLQPLLASLLFSLVVRLSGDYCTCLSHHHFSLCKSLKKQSCSRGSIMLAYS
jgi:hypothetical protein